MPERRNPFAPWWQRRRDRERGTKISRVLRVLCAFGFVDVGLVAGYAWAVYTR